MGWMSIMLTRDDIKAGKDTHLRDAFLQALLAAGEPKAAAMFQNDPSIDEHGHYFSPAAVAIFAPTLETFDADECDPPPRADTSLLVGDSVDAWELLSAP